VVQAVHHSHNLGKLVVLLRLAIYFQLLEAVGAEERALVLTARLELRVLLLRG
jgi:hypothetical protein